jgi:hypothetical protein
MKRWNCALALALLPLVIAGCALPVGARQTTPTVTPTPTSVLPTMLDDPLTSNSNGWTDDPARCFFQSDGYHVGKGFTCYAPTALLADDVATVSAKAVSGGSSYVYGIQFRQLPILKLNCYAFLVDTSGNWAVFKTVNDQDTELAPFTRNAAIKQGTQATNILEVRATGGHFEFFVNGTRVGQVNDSTFTRGFTGLFANSDGEAVFANLVIKGPGDTTKTLPPPPGTLIFNDPLTSDLGNLPPPDQTSFFSSDGYHMATSSVASYAYRDWTNASIQVTVRHLQGDISDIFGIAFRHDDQGNAYLFVITTDGRAAFLKLVNHNLIALRFFHATRIIRTGLHAVNTLEVRANGSHFECFINDVDVGSVDDATFATGKPGLVNDGGESAFSNFMMSAGN